MKRDFTRFDDEQVMRCAAGEISIGTLARLVRSSYRTLEKRAEMLGVELRTKSNFPKLSQRWTSPDHLIFKVEDGTPFVCTVGDDPLLSRLQFYHPEKAK